MARISNYSKDTNITGSDKLLGSDTGGATKNFVIEDLQKFIAETNTSGSSSSFTFQNNTSTPQSGQLGITTSSGSTFANITSIKVSKYNYKKPDKEISNALELLSGKDVLLYDVNDKNMYGVYKAGNVSVDSSDNNFYNLTLVMKKNNGSFDN